MASYLLGIDIGTTGSKALLVDTAGTVIASALTEYPMSIPHPLWAEQNPEDWWRATVESIRKVVSHVPAGSRVAGVGLTGQMHGLVLLDSSGSVLRPCIMWNDQRTAAECAAITKLIGAAKLLTLTGNPVLPGFTAPKIVWVRDHEPDVYRRIATVLLPKDYIRYRLTGTMAGDVSDASGTSLFDVARRCWSEEMTGALGIPRAWLPAVSESPEASSRISADAARATGITKDTPVAGGAGDQAAQAIGTGILEEGIVSVTTGTSGVVFAASKNYRIEPDGLLHAFCHAVPGMWHLMGVMLSAGGSFRWFRDTIAEYSVSEAKARKIDPYEILTAAAATVPPGSEGLIFLPYLSGERTPYANPNARGVFFGLTLRHTKPFLTRAVMEGVTFGLRDSLELIRALGITVREVRASGGGARSALWRQIMADTFGASITTVNTSEGAALGAALLGGVCAGCYSSVQEACRAVIKTTGNTAPAPGAMKTYEGYYKEYRELYGSLVERFDRLAQLDSPAMEEVTLENRRQQ